MKAKTSDQHKILVDLYKGLLLVRRAEESLSSLFADGIVPGFIHLSIGQEAIAVGIGAHLSSEDTVASTHRGHGHALAKGVPLEGFFAEVLGKEEGLCKGRGGSMHVADLSVGMLGANGIVAAGSSIAVGSALAHKTLSRDAIAVVFFGDGALAEGLLHESLNMAQLLALPVLFVCENNGWSEFSPTSKQVSFNLEKWSAAYDVPYMTVNGNDVVAVHETAGKIIAKVRTNQPAVLECQTTRVRGHYEGDPQKYRGSEEFDQLADRDPIRIAATKLLALGVKDQELAAILDHVEREVSGALSAARNGRDPDFESARRDVYTGVGA